MAPDQACRPIHPPKRRSRLRGTLQTVGDPGRHLTERQSMRSGTDFARCQTPGRASQIRETGFRVS
ncbi:protein of unknown function [Methylorubrum extorquens]|uniref:Uncharacterized protein n=1 Tax=Methylorubrum extorquens TaxID=408 RepID=A0A2N9AXW5_METEX|nr:protein of unknown function [Methylorubrum extorquens]